MRKSNYDKHPFVLVEEENKSCVEGWEKIGDTLSTKLKSLNKKITILVIECYVGVYNEELINELQKNIPHQLWINITDAFKDEKEIRQMIQPDVTDDAVFGFITRLTMQDYFDDEKVKEIQISAAKISKGNHCLRNGSKLSVFKF